MQIPAKEKTGTVQKWFTKMPALASSGKKVASPTLVERMQPFLNIMNLM
jgi:hypothetical protein